MHVVTEMFAVLAITPALAMIARTEGPLVQSQKNILWGIAIGAVLGPTLGVWLTQESIKLIDSGIAATLIALTPIFMVPLARLVYGERVSLRAIAGTVVTFLGIMLLLWP